MTFTDEDLKRLKHDWSNHKQGPQCSHGCTVVDAIPALIARLEAAEKMISDTDPCSCEAITGRQCIHQKHYEAWRKAAGK